MQYSQAYKDFRDSCKVCSYNSHYKEFKRLFKIKHMDKIKQLRQLTALGVSECLSALISTDCNIEESVEVLKNMNRNQGLVEFNEYMELK